MNKAFENRDRSGLRAIRSCAPSFDEGPQLIPRRCTTRLQIRCVLLFKSLAYINFPFPSRPLTEQFIQECLDRHPYDIDMSKLILEIAQGRNVTDALLARVSRRDIIEWLGNEMEVIVDGLVPALAQQAAGESG
jgi:hypothetical protein